MKEPQPSVSLPLQRRALLHGLVAVGLCAPMSAQAAKKHIRNHSTLDSPANETDSSSSNAVAQEGVAGVVLDAAGAPIAGALIQPSSTDHSGPIPDMAVMSGPDGRFMWRLKPGRYRIDAIVDGSSAASANVTVKAGALTSIELRVGR